MSQYLSDKDSPNVFIDCLHDLKPFGVNVLTGEACGIGLRLLCDLTDKGADMIDAYLGTTIKRGNGWNDGVASIMLTHNETIPLAVFALLHNGYKYAVVRMSDGYGNTVIGTNDDTYPERAQRVFGNATRVYCASGTAGLRNSHEFSGRVD